MDFANENLGNLIHSLARPALADLQRACISGFESAAGTSTDFTRRFPAGKRMADLSIMPMSVLRGYQFITPLFAKTRIKLQFHGQAKGDSIRRQKEKAENFGNEVGLPAARDPMISKKGGTE